MTYATIEEGESTPLQNGGGYSTDSTFAATPRTKQKRSSSGILRSVMVGTTVGTLLLLTVGPSRMTTINSPNTIDGMVVVSSTVLQASDDTPCLVPPAGAAFSGLSCKNSHGYCAGPGGSFGEGVHMHQYETCYVSNNSPPNDRCWSRSHILTVYDSEGFIVNSYPRCDPVGYNDGEKGYDKDGVWHVQTPLSDGSCGNPCREFK